MGSVTVVPCAWWRRSCLPHLAVPVPLPSTNRRKGGFAGSFRPAVARQVGCGCPISGRRAPRPPRPFGCPRALALRAAEGRRLPSAAFRRACGVPLVRSAPSSLALPSSEKGSSGFGLSDFIKCKNKEQVSQSKNLTRPDPVSICTRAGRRARRDNGCLGGMLRIAPEGRLKDWEWGGGTTTKGTSSCTRLRCEVSAEWNGMGREK